MKYVVVYSKSDCSWCDKAKELLNQLNISFEEKVFNVDFSRKDLQQLVGVDKIMTVPQIVIDNQLIGGYNDLVKYVEVNSLMREMENGTP